IGAPVAVGILLRAGALAQHVEGIAIDAPGARLGALQRLLDGLAEHEVVAEHAHGLARGRTHCWQADALGELAKDALGRLAGLDDARRDTEGPGRGRDEEGVGLRLVAGEVALAELVL